MNSVLQGTSDSTLKTLDKK